ncbi:MAG TPA: efflux RND transporter periplasmic adaptor subunit [Gammaproteobacteria bacterium]
MDIVRTDLKIKRQRRRWMIGSSGGIALVALTVFLFTLDPAVPAVERESVWMDTVQRGEMLRQVRGPGVLVPKEVLWIAARTNARVERVLVKPGAVVEPDTVLVDMSNPELVQQLEEARSAVAAAEAEYAALEVQLQSQLLDQKVALAEARAEYESQRLQVEAEKELAKDNIISQLELKRSILTAEHLKVRLEVEQERSGTFEKSVQAQLRAEQARIAQLKNMLSLRETQVAGLAVKAGMSGVLQALGVEEGQQLTIGANIARIARPDELMAELRIAETQAKDVQLGQPVSIDTRNGIVEGEVIRIDPAVENGTVQVDVALTGELPPGARPDLSVDGTILIERLEDVLYVGRPAYGQPESTVRLFVIDEETGEAVRVPVELGRSSVNVIEIRKGLEAGDRVILSDTSAWDKYDRIRLE